MFEKLKNRYIIKGKVVMDTGLHIGSGDDSFETDALVIKDSEPAL
jgi:CRISPR/Cas system CSM-associated protein Csm3 (group 7 of RAMP superfamily)